MGKLCGDRQPDNAMMTTDEPRSLTHEAYTFVTKYIVGLFGPTNTSKMHRLAYHLLDELLLRGNLVDGDTSENKMLHKLCKIMYQRSNKNVDHFLLQLLRCEQTLAFVTAEDHELELLRKAGLLGKDKKPLDATARGQAAAERAFMDGGHSRGDGSRPSLRTGEHDHGPPARVAGGPSRASEAGKAEEQPRRSTSESADGRTSALTGGAARSRMVDEPETSQPAHAPPRTYGTRVNVGDAEKVHGGELRGLGALLVLRKTQILTVSNSLPFEATFSCSASGRRQDVRTSDRL